MAHCVFNALNIFFTEPNIQWDKCIGLSTDGARSMSGKLTGLMARVKSVAPYHKP